LNGLLPKPAIYAINCPLDEESKLAAPFDRGVFASIALCAHGVGRFKRSASAYVRFRTLKIAATSEMARPVPRSSPGRDGRVAIHRAGSSIRSTFSHSPENRARRARGHARKFGEAAGAGFYSLDIAR
jgi:hypothetical protein